MEEKVEEEEGEEGVRDVERQGAPVEKIPMFCFCFLVCWLKADNPVGFIININLLIYILILIRNAR